MLLGREVELAAITGHLDRVLSSDGGALVLRGEAGAGKSALLAAATEGASVLGILGGVQFPITGPVRYSMTGAQAVRLCELMSPHRTIPVHYEGWAHFQQGRPEVERAFADAPPDIRDRLQWLTMGEPSTITV